jgi:hypothetical protein
MNVYIGGPIDQARSDCTPQEQFAEIARLVVNGLGPDTVVFNPFSAFINAGGAESVEDLWYIININDLALKEADLAVFVWNGSPSFGMPIEIIRRIEYSKPYIVWNRSGKRSGVYLRHRLHTSDGSEYITEGELLVGLQEFRKKVEIG